MNIIERIKRFFKGEKQAALPEGNFSQVEYPNTNNNAWLLSGYQNNQYVPTKLDLDIDRFLKAYSNQIEQINDNEPINNYKVAYASLVNLGGKAVTQDEYNNNSIRENMLLNKVSDENKYNVQFENGFYHVQSQGYQMPDFQDMIRVYVNCNNGNIAQLTQNILDNNQNPNFYLKFVSNDGNAQCSRGEKMVIYCDKNDYNYTLELLQYCKQNNPELFQESENIPFLENVNDIANVAWQPTTNQYTNLYGQNKPIAQSVNAFITNILEESYMETAREIARADNNLSFLLNENSYYDETLYMKNYPYIDSTQHDYLLQSMKAKMQVLAQKNNIYIDGLDTRENQNWNNRNYEQNYDEKDYR